MNVLVVDDKHENRYLLEVLLRSAGHEIVLACDGVEALARLDEGPVDLVVSDILMPEMDGFQLCRRLKEEERFKEIPFIFYTSAYTTRKDERFALSLGADRFLTKPMDPEKFLAAVEETAAGGGTHGEASQSDEKRYLREYGERVFKQLEKKMVELEGANRDLNERLRELDCLHSVLSLGDIDSATVEEILQKTAENLPSGFRYAGVAGARVTFDGTCYDSQAFVGGEGGLVSDLVVDDRRRGSVEVRYRVEKPSREEGPFLIEERKLVNSAALHLGRFISRREASAALQESEERYRATVESIGDGITIQDRDLNILWANPVALEHHGDIVGRKCHDVLRKSDEACGDCIVRQALTEGRIRSCEMALYRKDGTTGQYLVTAAPMHEKGGASSTVVMTLKDITEKKRLEKQFLQSQKMEAIGRLAGGVAHDFNNLMAAITFSAEWILLKNTDDDPRNDKVRTILETTERAARLTRQLLAFSRRQVVEPVWLDLNGLIREMEKMLSRLVGEDIGFRTSLEEGIDAVRADPVQIEQILLNLVVNAREAMPRGGALSIVTERVGLEKEYCSRREGVEPGDYVRLSVNDTGDGIADEDRGSIFEPFYTTKAEGTGLGLSTVASIARQIGGHVDIYSRPGEGTSFSVYIPSREAGRKLDGRPGETGTERPGGNERILLVEDDETFRPIIVEILQDLGYDVTSASSAAAVRDILGAAAPFDLLLSDVGLPDARGPDIAAEVQVHSPGAGIIFMSGYADALLQLNWQKLDAAAFLAKPFSGKMLAEKIRSVLDTGKDL